MRLIHLIRHAKPALTGVFLGRLDVPLAPQDVLPSALQAAVVYSSPLRRARETAALLFPARGIDVVPDLAECDFGDWEGLSWDEVQRRWPETAGVKAADWRGVPPPNGESWPDFELRVRRAYQRILEGSFPAAVVAHGGVNSILAGWIAGLDPLTFQQNYSEVFTFELHD